MSQSSDPDTTPAAQAPPGEVSRLNDAPSRDAVFVALHVVAIVLATPWVLVRMYTRKFVTRWVWWDDWTCVLGWAFFVALCGMIFACIEHGGGKDVWDVSKAEDAIFSKLFRNLQIVARVGMFFAKASLLLFYHRLFIPDSKSPHRRTPIWWSIWFVFWWNLLYCVALILTILLDCVDQPDKKAKGESCIDGFAVLISASVINVVTDLMLFVIPIAGIWGLQMGVRRKWRVSGIFAFSFLGVAASVARLGYQVSERTNPNSTLVIMILITLNTAEHFIAITVSCMPVLPALYRHFKKQTRDTHPSRQSDPYQHRRRGDNLKSWTLKTLNSTGTSRVEGVTREAGLHGDGARRPSSAGTSDRAMVGRGAPFAGESEGRREDGARVDGGDERAGWEGGDVESGVRYADAGDGMVVRRTSITIAEDGGR